MTASPARFRLVRTMLAAACIFTGASAVAASAASVETPHMHIETEHYSLNDKTGEFSMPVHVKFTRPGTDLVGDRAHGNEKTEQITVDGNVVLHNAGGFQPGTISSAKIGPEPQTLTCDQLVVDAKAKNYIATGNMHFTQGNRSATAVRAQLNEAAHTLTLDGNVTISDAKQTFKGDHMIYDTLSGQVHATGSPGVLDAPGMHVETTAYDYNNTTGDFSMPNHVKFVRDGVDAVGDRAAGNTQTETVTITGNVVLHNSGGYAASGKTSKNVGDDPQTLTCNELQIDSKNKHYIATGNMHFTQGARKADADKGDLDDANHKLALSGNVKIASGGRTFGGDDMIYDTENGTFDASGRPGIITAPVATPRPKIAKAAAGKKGKRGRNAPSPSPAASAVPPSPVPAGSAAPAAAPSPAATHAP